MGKFPSGCEKCSFTKQKNEYLNYEFKIGHGTKDGDFIVVKGLGEQPHKPTGEEPGDLLLKISVKHDPVFFRKGDDLVWMVKIPFEDSVNGARFTCPHYGGDFEVDTSKWGVLDPREDYKIPGKGFNGGCMRVSFDIKYPESSKRFKLEPLTPP
jgi:DnaJ-class molecular chaperone